MLYTKHGCPACERAKLTLGLNSDIEAFPTITGIEVQELSPSSSPSDAITFERLAMISGRRTVPVVFIAGAYIGGGDDVVRLGESGELFTRLLLGGAISKENAEEFLKNGNHTKASATANPFSLPPPQSFPPTHLPSTTNTITNTNTPINFSKLLTQIQILLKNECDLFANAANVSSAVFHMIQSTRGVTGCNWCGFYFSRKILMPKNRLAERERKVLVLGPFVGKPACRRIEYSEGVCGACARTEKVQLVADVHQFPGHIACDSSSDSEVVVPVFDANDELVGVFDIDCPILNGFSEEDANGLEEVVRMFAGGSDFDVLGSLEDVGKA